MEQQKKQTQLLLGKAFFYLQFRARSEFEMREYLQKKAEKYNYEPTIVELAITTLIEKNYINDANFAQAYVRSKSQINPKGNYAITQELRQKGINEENIEAALKENDIDELTRALQVLKRKNPLLFQLKNEKRMQRALGHLQRRGFPYDIAKQAYELHFNCKT